MSTDEIEQQNEVLRNFRRNAIAHTVDGAFFAGGTNFVSVNSILPVFVSMLSHSSILIGLITTITVVGTSLPQLVSANIASRYESKMELVSRSYGPMQRIPWLLMALVAYFVIPRSSSMGLVLFFICYGLYCIASGLSIPVWFDILVKTLPPDRRGKVLGIRYFCCGIMSVGAGYCAGWLLKIFEYPGNFALLFFLAFVFTTISLMFFIQIREPRQSVSGHSKDMLEYIRELPAIVKNDSNFSRLLIANVLIGFGGMAGAFYTVYAIEQLHTSPASAGTFAAIILGSQTLSNLIWGRFADRSGYKRILEISLVILAAAAFIAFIAHAKPMFILALALFGASTGGTTFTGLNIITELCDPNRRTVYVSIYSTCNAPVAGLSPIIGGVLADQFGYRSVFLVSTLFIAAGFVFLATQVRTGKQACV